MNKNNNNEIWEIIINYVGTDIEIKLFQEKFSSFQESYWYIEKYGGYHIRNYMHIENIVEILEKHKHNNHTFEMINWDYLCQNENAISFIQKHNDKINWKFLSMNKKAIHLLEQNIDKIDWNYLSRNENAIHLLEQNIDKIDWSELSMNKKAIHLLEQNLDKINWDFLSSNENAIHLLEQNIDKINWNNFSNNNNILIFINKYKDKISYENGYVPYKTPFRIRLDILCNNKNRNIIPILEQNLDKIYQTISYNINAEHIIEKNLDKIDWNSSYIWSNQEYVHLLSKIVDTRDLLPFHQQIQWDRLASNKNFITYYPTHLLRKLFNEISETYTISNFLQNTQIDSKEIFMNKVKYKYKKEQLLEYYEDMNRYYKIKINNMTYEYNNKVSDYETKLKNKIHNIQDEYKSKIGKIEFEYKNNIQLLTNNLENIEKTLNIENIKNFEYTQTINKLSNMLEKQRSTNKLYINIFIIVIICIILFTIYIL